MADPVKFFSVLGALARAAPQKMTGAQWQRYLSPGRILDRSGVRFPLRKDELLYGAGPELLKHLEPSQTFSPDYVAGLHDDLAHLNPRFDKLDQVGSRPWGPHDPRMNYADQYQLPGPKLGQAEHLTLLPGSDFSASSHFGGRPGLLSWNRTTDRAVVGPGGRDLVRDTSQNPHMLTPIIHDVTGLATNLEEAQSDWHQQARKRGYGLTPEEQDLSERFRRSQLGEIPMLNDDELSRLRPHPMPNAPYADTWQSLELRKALADAVDKEHDYLTWTTGQQQVDRYPGLNPEQRAGMLSSYDRDLVTDARRLSRQYGGPDVGQVQLPGLQNIDKNDPRWEAWQTLQRNPVQVPQGTLNMALEDLVPNVNDDRTYDDFNEILMDVHAGLRNIHELHDLTQQMPRSLIAERELTAARERYQRRVQDLKPFLDQNTAQTVHGLQLTPELKAKVRSAGLPLYSAGALAGAGTAATANQPTTEDTPIQYRRGGRVQHLASGGSSNNTITYPPLGITVHDDPNPSSLYGLGPSFQFIEYGTDAPPPSPPVVPPVTPPVVTPPAAGGAGAGTGAGGGGSPGGSGQSGNSGSAGAAGDYVGHPGRDANGDLTGRSPADVSTALAGMSQDPTDPGYFTVPRWVDNLYRGVEAVMPWQVSLPMALAHTAAQGFNASIGDQARQDQGIKPLSFLQWAGALGGFNPYGDLHNPLVANSEDFMNGVSGQVDPRTDQSLYGDPTTKYAETLTGEPASYGPFGIFGSSGPNNLSYQQAHLAMNPALAPRLFTATGQNFVDALGLPLSQASRDANSLKYDANGALSSYMGTPISAGGINLATGATEYTPGEAAARAAAVHAKSASSNKKSAITGALGSGVPGLSGNDRDPTGYSSSAGGYGYVSGGGQSYDAASGSWGAPDTGNDGGSGSGMGSNTRGGYARGGRVDDLYKTHGHEGEDYGTYSDGDPIWVRHGNYAAGGTVVGSHVRGQRQPPDPHDLYFPDKDWVVHFGGPDDTLGPPDTPALPSMRKRTTFARGGVARPTTSDYVGHPGRSELAPLMDSLAQDEAYGQMFGQQRLAPPHYRPLAPLGGATGNPATLDLGLDDYHELPPLDAAPPPYQDVNQPPLSTPPAAPPPPALAQAPPTDQAPGGPVDPNAYPQQVAALEALKDKQGNVINDSRNPVTGAAGKYQFLQSTWDDLARRHPELKLKPFDQNNWKDPKPQDLALNSLTSDNVAQLKQRYGLDKIGPAEMYATHLLGASGGGRLLAALRTDPDAPVTRYVAPSAAVANHNVFYGKVGPLTVRQAYDRINRSLAAGRWDLAA